MANEEQINRENAENTSTKDVSVPVSKDATLHIPKDVLKEELNKIYAEEKNIFDCEKVAAKYFMEHPSTPTVVDGRCVMQYQSYEEILKLVKATPEPIVKELARLYDVNKQLKDQALRNDGYKLAAMDLSSKNGNY